MTMTAKLIYLTHDDKDKLCLVYYDQEEDGIKVRLLLHKGEDITNQVDPTELLREIERHKDEQHKFSQSERCQVAASRFHHLFSNLTPWGILKSAHEKSKVKG